MSRSGKIATTTTSGREILHTLRNIKNTEMQQDREVTERKSWKKREKMSRESRQVGVPHAIVD